MSDDAIVNRALLMVVEANDRVQVVTEAHRLLVHRLFEIKTSQDTIDDDPEKAGSDVKVALLDFFNRLDYNDVAYLLSSIKTY